ncbi:TetR family transcriptional regulator [Cricetibacter osteomyelitidis]|uniref:TetR family transcriptional regulator n=1 Tax=Cricetibacter osteomyelitidis TaxID=1521931 RepID=A0A4R2T082_9PAST|nr:TetR/AcrR family transcriptional regulator [Cricetibacter osteomyelitidis]TCP94681.1 TetR family transcriptional regulator [Cricetibacter osteomyelitidis]
MSQKKVSDMTNQIFAATERLMAEHGLHYLSMHKIAKEAGISAGSIYVYFKNKEELLELLVRNIFDTFQQELTKNWDPEAEPFQQYRQLWLNLWNVLLNRPSFTLNMSQYQSLPNFHKIVRECKSNEQDQWHIFCKQAIERQVLVDLPTDILWILSLEGAIHLAYYAVLENKTYSTALLETIIERSWRSIKK